MAKRKSPAATGQSRNQKMPLNYSTIARRIKASRRYSRATNAMLRGPVDRPELDKIVGTTNAPMYVLWLREMGLTILMERINSHDRDKRPSWFGRYHLSSTDRQQLRKAFAELGVKL